MSRLDQLDLEQLGGAPGQRVHRNLDTGRERTADILPLRADRVEVGRGAEVDDHRGAAVQVDRRQRVHDPVAAGFLGIVGPHRDARLHAGFHDQRPQVRIVTPAHQPHLMQYRRHRRAQRDPVDVLLAAGASPVQEPVQHDRQLIGGAVRDRREPPVLNQLVPVEDAEDHICVADINGEQQRDLPGQRGHCQSAG